MKKLLYTAVLSLAFITIMYAQNDPVKENIVERLIETIAENNEENELDYTALLEDLNYYYENPVNLNSATREELQKLCLLTDYQITELFNYLKFYGRLLTIYETQFIKGWDASLLYYILPFVSAEPVIVKKKLKFKTIFAYGKNELTLRYAQFGEESKGFSEAEQGYLGSPFAMQFRYKFSLKDRISFGFTAEKDRGEQFFRGYNPQGFDFYSGHIFLKDFGVLQKLAIGDFQAQFGQGLTFWSGSGFGKSGMPLNVKRFPGGLKRYTAANEFNYNRGIGAEFKVGSIYMTGFYSMKQLDGNTSQADSITGEILEFSSFLETGYHRTENEIANRNKVLEMLGGGNIQFRASKWNVGITAVHTWYNKPLQKSGKPYNKYVFQGQQCLNVGADYNLLLGKFYLFGELAISGNGGYALTQGIQVSLATNFSLVISYRDFSPRYQALYVAPFADRSGAQNERGAYMGFEATPFSKVKLQGYFDVFQYPWLRFNINAPSWGYDWLLQTTYLPNRKVEVYARIKRSARPENGTQHDTYMDPLVHITKTSYRIHATYEVSKQLKFKSRIEFITLEDPAKAFRWGFMVYQDFSYKPVRFPVALSAGIALFNTDDYDTRLYAYESDLLYSFSVPAYYYKGMRFYITLKWEIVKGLSCGFRIAQTYMANRKVMGSGLDEINGNTKTEIKAQLHWRFSLK